MKVVVIAERLDANNGTPFRTCNIFEHTPVEFNRGVPGWQGTRSRSNHSEGDLQKMLSKIGKKGWTFKGNPGRNNP